MLTQIETNAVNLSPTAVQAIRDLFAERKLGDNEYALRVYVAGRTCSGLQYGMALDNKPGERDLTFETEGIKLLIDDVSIEYMRGATIDFADDERGKGFVVENPNAQANCDSAGSGCSCGM